MFAKMMIAAALLATSGLALASDASYDQQQIRNGTATLVEGSLQAKSATNDAQPAAHGCACCQHHHP
jgi:hypothetical protein